MEEKRKVVQKQGKDAIDEDDPQKVRSNNVVYIDFTD